jgi:hypothetical protein
LGQALQKVDAWKQPDGSKACAQERDPGAHARQAKPSAGALLLGV